MNHDYADIREGMLPREPLWFDEHAVPRYCEFAPDMVADIYATEAVLFEVACQGCGQKFLVADVRSQLEFNRRPTLKELIETKELHYGDPPNTRCCAAGPTMNSEPRRVIEYWHTHHKEFTEELPSMPDLNLPALGRVTNVAEYFKWRREPMLEVDVTPDWVTHA